MSVGYSKVRLMTNFNIQYQRPRPMQLVVHISIGGKRTLDDDRKGDRILYRIPTLKYLAAPINTVLTYAGSTLGAQPMRHSEVNEGVNLFRRQIMEIGV